MYDVNYINLAAFTKKFRKSVKADNKLVTFSVLMVALVDLEILSKSFSRSVYYIIF